MNVNPYLNFDGNAKEAFEFYRTVFGGELKAAISYNDFPMEGVTIPEEEGDKMMHIALPLGDDHTLMATDVLGAFGQGLVVGNNTFISLHPDSREEADRIFEGLSEGGQVEMPMSDQAWGDYYGSFTDRFGIKWMINHTPDPQD